MYTASLLLALLCAPLAPATAADGGPPPETVRQALVKAERAVEGKRNACLECHKDSHADARHAEKDVSCQGCHANITDGQVKHAGSLDAFPPEKMCGQCHEAITQRQLTGAHKSSTCDSCHGSVHQDFKRVDYSSCSDCHSKETKALAASIHTTGKRKVGCAECHGDLHDPKRKDDPFSPMSKVLQVSTCGECHNTPYVHAYSTSVHGQGLLRSGLVVAPTCTDCHGAHDIAGVKDPASRLSRKNVIDTCGNCHTFIATRWEGSAHGRAWADKSPTADREKAPVCTTCHKGHVTGDPRVFANYLEMANVCAGCHHEAGETYRDTFHGKASNLGMAAATCADCHSPHDMLYAGDPRSTVNKANLIETCGKCHQPINASFIQFDPHMNPHDVSRSAPVHYMWLLMTVLLVGVLGFFTLHSILWLQRSIVASARGELPPHKHGDGRWVRRFSPLEIWIHVAIAVSFLLLAATGLPLKFSDAGWPRWFENIFGGLAAARWIHRAAGIVTFGYAGVFLAFLIREIVVRRRYELLWGWKSMVPNLKDLSDIIGNVRWFLYLGPPPKLDRWTYWEKFDFFAVFWGIPMIGLSGLALWIPLAVSRVMPGWVLNMAALIHSDEALMAVGFILFFHFFHTHLRPAAFPLDPVVFLGRMPIERFQQDRPTEYARLVESGELDKLLAPAPTEIEFHRAYLFGGITLVVGSVLALVLLTVGLRGLFH